MDGWDGILAVVTIIIRFRQAISMQKLLSQRAAVCPNILCSCCFLTISQLYLHFQKYIYIFRNICILWPFLKYIYILLAEVERESLFNYVNDSFGDPEKRWKKESKKSRKAVE